MQKKIRGLLLSQNVKNTIWNFVNALLYPLFLLITTPFFISRLGAEQYGIWMLMNSITQFMSILNLGLGDVNIKYLSKYRVSNDHVEINNTISTTFALALILFAIAVIAGFVLSYLIQYHNLFNISPHLKDLAIKSTVIALLLFGLKFIEVIVLSVFQGFERYDFSSSLSLLSRLTTLILSIAVVYAGGNLVGILKISGMTLLLFVVFDILILKQKFNVNFIPKLKRKWIKEVFSFGFWTWLQSVMAIVTTQADKFIVVYFAGVQTLAYYSLGSMLTTQIHSTFSSIIGWVFPAVSKKSSNGESVSLYFKKINFILLLFGFSAIIFFLFVHQYLLLWWLGEDTYFKAVGYIKIFVYYNLFLLLNLLPYYFLNGTGHVKVNTASEFATKLLNILGMVFFYKWLGTIGLIWGLIVSMLVATPIKISLLKIYAFDLRKRIWGVLDLIPAVLIILFFESQITILKISFFTAFIISFYFIFARPFLRDINHESSAR